MLTILYCFFFLIGRYKWQKNIISTKWRKWNYLQFFSNKRSRLLNSICTFASKLCWTQQHWSPFQRHMLITFQHFFVNFSFITFDWGKLQVIYHLINHLDLLTYSFDKTSLMKIKINNHKPIITKTNLHMERKIM